MAKAVVIGSVVGAFALLLLLVLLWRFVRRRRRQLNTDARAASVVERVRR